MLEVPAPDGSQYCIDRTEVTNGQYKLFLDANVPTGSQPSFCSWNSNFAPEKAGGCATGALPYDPGPAGKDKSVACVDWCDAYAYCAWAGKRLCGKIGGESNALTDYDDPARSAWYNVCSMGGSMELPYGSSYVAGYCNDGNGSSVLPESSLVHPACEGGFSGIFGMVGNVAEWEDSCSAQSSSGDQCALRGGGFLSFPTSNNGAATCNSSKLGAAPNAQPPKQVRSHRDQDIGFRCCYP
jgi:formylglycine-generating enzyme required for sulfatase activity